MGSYINFKNYGDTSQPEVNGEKPPENGSLARQSSIYSLTFDELQNTYGGLGKDLGSMNMEDLLKNIWTAEESQAMACPTKIGDNGNLQRQPSLTLPRTLSTKTVEQVWKDMYKESTVVDAGGSSIIPSGPTLGEITLEEFLMKAGVVREDIESQTMGNSGGFYGGLTQPSSLNIAFTQPLQNQYLENINPVLSPHQQQGQTLFPKQTTLAFSQVACPKGPGLGMKMTNLPLQGGVTGSVVTGNLDTSSLSGSPYAFSEDTRGRRSGGALEKVVERRRKRMIKNRESAARSRARKQAYTLELEEEISKLKEVNQELKKKQAELMEMQKNQILETMKIQQGGKKRCLRRTLTGPW